MLRLKNLRAATGNGTLRAPASDCYATLGFMAEWVERYGRISVKWCEGRRLESCMNREKRFNRKVALNRQQREQLETLWRDLQLAGNLIDNQTVY